jgi:predicted acetyltransferase
MVWEDEELVTNIHIVERTAIAGEQPVRLGGIGNVATMVEWRKRGYATEALKVAVVFLHDPLNVDFGPMIATEKMIPSYEKRGWKVVAQSMLIDQPDGKQAFNIPVMTLPICMQE